MGRLVQRVIDAESRELIRELTRDPDPGVLWDARFDLLPLSTSANEGQLKAALKAMGLTLTRASGATVQVNASQVVTGLGVDAPRVGNGGYGSGLVIEESRTNYIYASHVYKASAGVWTADVSGFTGTDNYTTGPDGSSVADRGQCVSGGYGPYYYGVATSAGAKYTGSLWVKSPDGSTRSVNALVKAGASTSYINVTADSTWKRASATATQSGSLTGGLAPLAGTLGTQAAQARDYVVDNPQYEQGAFPTELIITGAATATRAADVLKVDRWNRAVDRGSIGIEFSFVPKCRPADSTVDQWLFGDTGSNLWIAVTLAGQVSMRTTAVSPAVTGAGVANWNAGDSVKVYVEMGGGKAYLALSVNGVVSKPALSNTNQLDIPDNHASEPRLFNYQGTYLTNCWARRVRTFRKGVRPQWAR